MRKHALPALGLVALSAGAGCATVTTEGEPLDLEPWAKSFEAAPGNLVAPVTVASGPDGDLFLGGTFTDRVDLGGGALYADFGQAVFLAHLDRDGEHLFSGSTGSGDFVHSSAIAPEGDLYAVGDYDGAINFGAGKLTGYKNGYLAAFEAGGASDFSLAIGGEADDSVDDVAVTPSGNIVIAARAGDDADFTGGAPDGSYSRKDTVFAAYDRDGELLWTVRMPEANGGALSVTSDAAGNVLLTGRTWVPSQLGDFPVETASFIGKISAAGSPLWLRTTTSTDFDLPLFNDVTVGPDGDIYVVGANGYGQFTIGGFTSTFADAGGTFWLRLSPEGEVRALHDLTARPYSNPPQLAVAPDGDVILGFSMYDAADLGGGLVGAGVGQDAVVARFTPEGEHVRSLEIQGTNNEYLADVAVDPDGNTVVLGWFDATVEIGGTELSTDQSQSLFVARLDF
jgi:hypothetical protein